MTNQKTDSTPYRTLRSKSEGLMGARNAPPPHIPWYRCKMSGAFYHSNLDREYYDKIYIEGLQDGFTLRNTQSNESKGGGVPSHVNGQQSVQSDRIHHGATSLAENDRRQSTISNRQKYQ